MAGQQIRNSQIAGQQFSLFVSNQVSVKSTKFDLRSQGSSAAEEDVDTTGQVLKPVISNGLTVTIPCCWTAAE